MESMTGTQKLLTGLMVWIHGKRMSSGFQFSLLTLRPTGLLVEMPQECWLWGLPFTSSLRQIGSSDPSFHQRRWVVFPCFVKSDNISEGLSTVGVIVNTHSLVNNGISIIIIILGTQPIGEFSLLQSKAANMKSTKIKSKHLKEEVMFPLLQEAEGFSLHEHFVSNPTWLDKI